MRQHILVRREEDADEQLIHTAVLPSAAAGSGFVV